MGRIWVKEFTGGLDTRRMAATTPGGVLVKATDGHITAGGEFEQRAAFVSTYDLPAGTVGLAQTSSGLVVFGSIVAPTMPSGVSYQRLQHSDGTTAIDKVLSVDLYGGKLYVVAQFADGTIFHFYDGERVTDWFDGRARASFRVTGGEATTPSTLTSLKVNGVDILTGPLNWDTSNEDTAAAIAAAINSLTSTPDYDATAVGDQVNVIAANSGVAPNGFAISFAVADGFGITPATGIVLAGGVDSTGTFVPGGFVKTIGSKVYSVSGGVLHFSGIREPTKWTTDITGAGFIDMSQETSNAEELVAVANYQGFVAVFAGRVVLIYYVDPDPDLNAKSQILRNTGTNYPGSVTEFGDSDLFYLAESGCRSLRARDASNAASTTDIGVPIDTLVRAKLRSMTDAEKQRIIGLINPDDGRFWLCMSDEVFVFSFYSNAKVSAWTSYLPRFNIENAAIFNDKVYVRSGDTVYAYGGSGDTPTYDSTVAKAWLPFLEADKPSEFKEWSGFDAAVEGQWSVYAGQMVTDITVRELIATITETTFNKPRHPMQGEASHCSLQFEGNGGTGPARLSSAILHYLDGEDG